MKPGRLEAELWAQQGVDELCVPYRAVVPVRMGAGDQLEIGDGETVPAVTYEEAIALMRAAYAKGYGAALSEPVPDEIPEAAARAVTLALMLPV